MRSSKYSYSFVPYIKENFLYPFVIWKPAWKKTIILRVFCLLRLLSSPSIRHSCVWLYHLVMTCLLQITILIHVGLWMKITSFLLLLFILWSHFNIKFSYMEKWRPWCFQGFAKRVDLNEFKLIDADCCMLSQINSYLATTYFMEKPNSLITQYTRIERLILWILISHTNTLKWYQQ